MTHVWPLSEMKNLSVRCSHFHLDALDITTFPGSLMVPQSGACWMKHVLPADLHPHHLPIFTQQCRTTCDKWRASACVNAWIIKWAQHLFSTEVRETYNIAGQGLVCYNTPHQQGAAYCSHWGRYYGCCWCWWAYLSHLWVVQRPLMAY